MRRVRPMIMPPRRSNRDLFGENRVIEWIESNKSTDGVRKILLDTAESLMAYGYIVDPEPR